MLFSQNGLLVEFFHFLNNKEKNNNNLIIKFLNL